MLTAEYELSMKLFTDGTVASFPNAKGNLDLKNKLRIVINVWAEKKICLFFPWDDTEDKGKNNKCTEFPQY